MSKLVFRSHYVIEDTDKGVSYAIMPDDVMHITIPGKRTDLMHAPTGRLVWETLFDDAAQQAGLNGDTASYADIEKVIQPKK